MNKQPTSKEVIKFVSTYFIKLHNRTNTRLVCLHDSYQTEWILGGMQSVLKKHFGNNLNYLEFEKRIMNWYKKQI